MAINIPEAKKHIDKIKNPKSVVLIDIPKKTVETSASSDGYDSATEKDPVTRVQRAKEDAAAAKAPAVPSATRIRADQARKKLEMYLNSDTRKKWEEKQKLNFFSQNLLSGITGQQWKQEEDAEEQRLRAQADYLENAAKAEEENSVTARDMQEVESWEEADRQELERYIQNRKSAFVQSLNPAATGLPAQYEDSYLIEKYGRERLDEIAESYQRNRNYQNYMQAQQKGRDLANADPYGVGATAGSIASVVGNLADSLLAPLERIANSAGGSTGRYDTLDPYAGGTLGAYGTGVRQQTAENIEGEDPNLVRKGLALGYQGGMSFLDTTARALAGGSPAVGMGLAALGSFNQTLTQASAQGASPQQAVMLATINSGIEAATEKLPLDQLFKAAKGGAKPAAQVVKSILKQAGIEILEEEASLIGTALAEAAILQEKSGYQRQIALGVLSGQSYEQAKQAADRELLSEAIHTAIVSGISGGLGGAAAEYSAARFKGLQDVQQPQTAREEAQTQTPVQEEMAVAVHQETAQTEAEQQPEPNWMEQTFQDLTNSAKAEKVDVSGIETDMDENSRQRILAEKKINVVDDVRSANYAEDIKNIEALPAKAKSRAEKIIRPLAEKLGILNRSMKSPEVEMDFQFSKGKGLKESVNKQLRYGGSYGDFAKALSNLDEILQNAVLIEKHSDKYKGTVREDRHLESVSVLLGACRDGSAIIPVQMEIKKSSQNGGQLYVTVAMTKIEADVMGRAVGENQAPFLLPASDYSLTELISKINPEDRHFLKYVPDAFLNDDQKQAKQSAVQEDQKRIGQYARTGEAEVNKVTPKNNGDVTQTPAEGQMTNHETNAQSDFASPSPDISIKENTGNVNEDSVNSEGLSMVDTQRQSPEDGQVKGTGAAERGFTQKQAMINDYGNIPKGENPARPDQLPVSTDGTDRVSYTARTAMEARVTPDEFVPLIERETVNGGFSFIPITNDDTVQAATQAISREGWQTSRANWTANVRSGVTSPEITATGALLYNHAVNAGDHQEAMEILMDYQMAVRNTARSLQAARILKTLTPSDRLWMIRRSVDAMVQDMHLQHPITIDETLAQQYQNAGTQEEADEILNQIAENVARQIPATRIEAFTALRYLNMLGNLKTQGRNVLGNVGSKLVYGIKDKIGAGIETIASAVSGGRIERTKAFVTDRATRQAAAQDYENVQNWIMGGGRYNDRQTESDDFARRVQERRRLLPPGFEQARRLTQRAMDTGDAIFARSAYSRALAGYLNARGIRTDNLETVDQAILDRAREYAVRQAQEQTFRDNNQVSDFVSGFMRDARTPAWARVISEGILPFRKTPANVLVRAEEYSPLGLINSAVNTVRAARGQITGAELVESWAKTLTGTALTAMGMALYDMGILSGGPDEDEDKADFDQLNGEQNYALKLPGGLSYTIDWATPAAMPLFMGAELRKLFDREEDLQWADLEKVLTSIGDPLIQMSMLQGVSDTLGNIRNAENNLGQFLINATMSYLTQGLTNTLLGQMERSTEETRQTTYVDKDSAVPQWLQRQLGKASQKVPGWDYQQTDYINAKGETEQQRTDGLGWLYNLVSPGYIDRKTVDAVSQELYRLHDDTGENVFPTSPETTITWTDKQGNVHKDDHLTMEQADVLKRETGQISMRIAGDLIKEKNYAALSDGQKAKAIQMAYSYARETAEIAAIGDSHTGYTEGWMMELVQGSEASYILRKVAGDDIGSAMEALSTAWKNGYDEKPRSDDLKWAYDTFRAMSLPARNEIKKNISGTEAKYIEARESGISHDDFLRAAESAAKVTGTGSIDKQTGKRSVRDIDTYEAIAKTNGLTMAEVDTIMKCYIPDYDPNAKKPDYSELKYDYVRDKLALSPQEYVETYRAYLDGEKKEDDIANIMALGIDRKTATTLYDIYYSTDKGKAAYMGHYNGK